MTDRETLFLKWGTVKGWENLSDLGAAALQKWAYSGTSMSAMAHPKTDVHTDALCDAIDVIAGNGGCVWNDWDGVEMTADEAKSYVRNYGK